jgi:ABC-type transport system substrate-binding protein
MVESLFHVNEDLEVVPLLASDYEVTNGAQTWTVELEEGVQFHEPYQREMVADDVVHNINRIRDPDTGAAGASIMNPVEEVTAIDDYTVEFSLSEPAAGFNTALSAHTVAILSPEALEEQGDARNNPIGTGAFTLDEWQTGSYVRVAKNDSYWRGDMPYVDTVSFRPIREPAVQSTEIQEGNVDVISGTAPSYVETHRSADGINVEAIAGGGYTCVHINSASTTTEGRNSNTPTTDVNVRRAINHAISRTEMAEVVSSGYGTPTQQFYPEGNPWRIDYDRYGTESNPERAMELLEEAGYETPIPLSLITSPANVLSQMAVVVEDNLSNAGFDVSINEYETGTWVDEFFAHRYDLCVNFFPFYADPSQLRQFYHPEGVYVQPYVDGNNSSDQVMDLWSQGNQATDAEERRSIYAELQRTFLDDSVNAIMYHRPVIGSWRDSVQDYNVHPWGQEINVKQAWLDR